MQNARAGARFSRRGVNSARFPDATYNASIEQMFDIGQELVYATQMDAAVLHTDPAPAGCAPAEGWRSLQRRMQVVCGQLNMVHAELVELAAEALRTRDWQGQGITSLGHWLTWQAGVSATRANEVVRLAKAKVTHPETMAVLADGAISIDQAAIAVKAPAYLDRHFGELAPVATVAQLKVLVRAATPAPYPQPDTPEPTESLSGWFDDNGRYHLHGELDPDRGRIVDAALKEARDSLFQAGQEDVTWADALVEVVNRSIDTVTDERAERFRINWFIDPTDSVPARWIDGIAVPDWLRQWLTCDGTVSPVFTAHGRPVNVGTTQHAVPERTRRQVLYRDKKCRVPGCAQARWLQVHHVIHREHGGGHDLRDLIAICGTHHRMHHRDRLGITGNAEDPDGLTFTDEHGRVIDPATRPTKPTGPPTSPPQPYRHPLGERLDRSAIYFPDPPYDDAA